MSYKTNLTHNKREQLKSQMDDFATFQWRGHDMWDKYGCFIINESKGSLKFYNGPGYSNKYAKPQFSSSTNTLIGVDFKQKTIPMKIGMYWFTIEEYQEFLNEIGPYVINYLTFGYEKNYGYLVKLANIADSPRHVVGTNEDGDYVYYTEMDLTWELLGDNCVRSNLPYEYSYNYDTINHTGVLNCIDNEHADMKDDSLLDTPILFELPLVFKNQTAAISLTAECDKNMYGDELSTPISQKLFSVNLNNLTTGAQDIIIPGAYTLGPLWRSINYTVYTNNDGYFSPNPATTQNISGGGIYEEEGASTSDKYTITLDTANNSVIVYVKEGPIISVQSVMNSQTLDEVNHDSTSARIDKYSITLKPMENQFVLRYLTEEGESVPSFSYEFNIKTGSYYSSFTEMPETSFWNINIKYEGQVYYYLFKEANIDENYPNSTIRLLKSTSDSFQDAVALAENEEFEVLSYKQISKDQSNWFKIKTFNIDSIWSSQHYVYQMLLRYDSETGLVYIQEGDNDTWHLLNFHTDNNDGKYILSSITSNKWKIPGKFSAPNLKSTNWKFKIQTTDIDMSVLPENIVATSITAYARKNIV